MKIAKFIVGSLILLVVCSPLVQGQDASQTYRHPLRPPTMHELLRWKEVFRYKVTYGFFTLGEVKIQAICDTSYQGQKVWKLQSSITSNSSLPFVKKIKNHYNSLFSIGDSLPYTLLYWRDEVSENKPKAEEYRFDYTSGEVYMFKKGKAVDTLRLNHHSTSGLLIFLYSRLFAGTNKDYKLPVYLEHKKGYISASNSTRSQMRSYDAFKKAVKTYHSKGHADIDGPFGFKGDYEA